MKLNRRSFLKKCGIAILAGSSATWLFNGYSRKDLKAAQTTASTENLKKRWAMVIDSSKLKTEEDYNRLIESCHSLHNVPNFDNPKDEIKWIWKEDFKHTFTEHNHYLSPSITDKMVIGMCNHCENPQCVRVCPTKATFKREDGIVVVDYHRCVGCRFCMAACPFGARSFNFRDPRPFILKLNPEYPTRTKGVVEKCTFCMERVDKGQIPLCAEKSNGAIVFGDLNDPQSEVRKILASRYTIRRKPQLGTEPSIYYVIEGDAHA